AATSSGCWRVRDVMATTRWCALRSGTCADGAASANHGGGPPTMGSATRADDAWRGAVLDGDNVDRTLPSRMVTTRSTNGSRRDRSRSAATMVMPRLASSLRTRCEPVDKSPSTPSNKSTGVAEASAHASNCVGDNREPFLDALSTYATRPFGAT